MIVKTTEKQPQQQMQHQQLWQQQPRQQLQLLQQQPRQQQLHSLTELIK